MFSVDADNGEVRDEGGGVVLCVERKEGRNRSVVARKQFKRGDIVVQEVPYAMITPAMYAAVACSHCGKIPDANKGEQIFGVAADDPIRYCSQQCLRADAAVHELEVQAVRAFAALSIEGSTEAIRLIIRMAALKQQEVMALKLTLGTPEFPKWGRSNLFGHVLSLEAPITNIDEESLEDIQMVAQVLAGLLEDSSSLSVSEEEINHLLLAIQSNAHRVVDAEKRCVGLGIFPFVSMLNHSCSPNCAHHFVLSPGHPPSLVMQAITDIAPGDELCYNYIPLYQSTERRRAQLSSAYSFTCDCLRCTEAGSPSADTVASLSPPFPRDHILSEVDIIDSSTDNDSDSGSSSYRASVSNRQLSSLDFDNIVSCEGKVLHAISTELAMCNNLLASAARGGTGGRPSNPKACKSVIKKLLQIFADKNKAGALHPCHELMLSACVTCATTCEALLLAEEQQDQDQDQALALTPEEVLLFAQAAVGFGGLALGCILKFTRVRNEDVAALERVVGVGLRGLLHSSFSLLSSLPSSLHLSETEAGERLGGEQSSSDCCSSGCSNKEDEQEQCTASFVQVALAVLSSLNYVWMEHQQPLRQEAIFSTSSPGVVSSLLAHACSHAATVCPSTAPLTSLPSTLSPLSSLSQAFLAAAKVSNNTGSNSNSVKSV